MDPSIDDVTDGTLVKVVEVVDEGRAFFGRLANGTSARFSFGARVDLERGDVVLIGKERWWRAPQEAWVDDSAVGVVRKLLDDGVALEGGAGGIRVIHGTPRVSVDVGNTVEYNDIDGIMRIIAETPLRYRDVAVDEDLREYLVDVSQSDLTFESFGGYEDVVERARELIETQLNRRKKLKQIGSQPIRGVIFTGPPGTGKTHMARIIAHASKARFYLVSGPSIVSKYVGDSEETLRRIFAAASKQKRAIVFFDEIDSIAARRSNDLNGESKRVVAQLLTLMDGFHENSNVVVLAATNRIEDIDEALLRPGRFDWEIAFGLPSQEDRLKILAVQSRRLATSGELPLAQLSLLTEGWSGARLSAVWAEAALVAAGDGRRAIADEDIACAFERVRVRPIHHTEERHDAA